MKTILGENVREARIQRGWTQRQLAERVNGVDSLAVSRWERGQSTPTPENLAALATALDRDIAWLYTEREESAAA